MKKISLEEAYMSPYFKKYCNHARTELLEFVVLSGNNKKKYNWLLDPDNLRFKQADKENVTFVISATIPGSQDLIDINNAPIFCKLTNDYFKSKVDSYNKINNTHHSFFAVLPFNNVKSAIKELKRVNNFNPPINRVLFNGPTINNNNYDWLEGNKWRCLWEYANKNKTVFYIHPFIAKSYSNMLPDPNMKKYILHHPQITASQFGFHINDALFFLKLYVHNIFDNYSNIQWIAGHMGETLIWYLWRYDHRTKIYKNEQKSFEKLKNKAKKKFINFPKKTLTQIFTTQKGKKNAQVVSTTSGWFNTPALNFSIDNVGINNILFSIDTPYEKFDVGMKWFDNLKLSKNYKEKLGWKNANNILSIFPKKHRHKTTSNKKTKKNITKKRL